jgi:hypothetical protein
VAEYLITGTFHSGTRFTDQLLKALGISSVHETEYKHHGRDGRVLVSWAHAPPAVNQDMTLIHQKRLLPLFQETMRKRVNSSVGPKNIRNLETWGDREGFNMKDVIDFTDFPKENLKNPKVIDEYFACFWRHYNNMIAQQRPVLTYQVEDLLNPDFTVLKQLLWTLKERTAKITPEAERLIFETRESLGNRIANARRMQ